jgi:hypothetical protein
VYGRVFPSIYLKVVCKHGHEYGKLYPSYFGIPPQSSIPVHYL